MQTLCDFQWDRYRWVDQDMIKNATSTLCVFTCIFQAAKLTDLTDATDPAVHLLLCFGHQVKDARRGLHHKEVFAMEVSLYPELPVEHFDLTLSQVNGADWLLGVLALIVLQHIRITTHTTPAKHKPAFPPRLWEKGTNSLSGSKC